MKESVIYQDILQKGEEKGKKEGEKKEAFRFLSRQLNRKFGAFSIVLIPGFYSTVAASNDPSISAPNSRVDEINTLINQVALAENVPVETISLQPLNEKGALKEAFASSDGDHLNDEGIKIYRQALLKILK